MRKQIHVGGASRRCVDALGPKAVNQNWIWLVSECSLPGGAEWRVQEAEAQAFPADGQAGQSTCSTHGCVARWHVVWVSMLSMYARQKRHQSSTYACTDG